jgi:hypothetical protein
MARKCDKCDVLFIGHNSLDLLCCVQCQLQRCVACETPLAIKAHQSTKSIVRGNADWTCRNCLKLQACERKRKLQKETSAAKKVKKQPTVAQAAVEAKKGKKQQQGASATVVIHDDSSAAAVVKDGALGNVCPSCKQSTESSQLDGTRQCEG